MIERFNFYDLYGYLIPGSIWLLLLKFPFHLQFNNGTLSAVELTAGAVIGYVAGHLLLGLARQALPTANYQVPGEKDGVQKSVAVLWDGYSGKDRLPAGFRTELGLRFAERFGFNPLEPFDVAGAKQMFFLCRASLSQAKLAAYVEQYQGMGSLTRSLAFASLITAVYYGSWVVVSALRRMSVDPSLHNVLPLLILAAGILLADAVGAAMARAPGYVATRIHLTGPECRALIGILVFLGAASSWWYPLNSRHGDQMALASAVLWLATLRLKAASKSFDDSLVMAVYGDFVVLATAKSQAKPVTAKQFE